MSRPLRTELGRACVDNCQVLRRFDCGPKIKLELAVGMSKTVLLR